jgi:CRP-like cAMP-binding protein
MTAPAVEILRKITMFRRLSAEDLQRLAEVAQLREIDQGAMLFGEGDPSDSLFLVLAGRVKVFKVTARGTDVILEIFGTGDPVGAVAVYEARPYPASAVALEVTTCVLVPRDAFFALLEAHPTLVRGLLTGLSHRLVELTSRLAELSGGRIEARLARLLIKLADEIGQGVAGGVFIPMPLSRQELADMVGTTIETTIRIMSKWGKHEIVLTEKDGFILRDRGALDALTLN